MRKLVAVQARQGAERAADASAATDVSAELDDVATTTDDVELATRLRIAFALMSRAERQNVPDRLTPVQLSALYKVDVHGPLRLGDLAAREQVAGPTMCRVVASLEGAGLVTRDTDPTSARCSLVAVTPAGRDQIDAVRRDRTDIMACRLAKLSPRQHRALVLALPAIEALVEAVIPGDDIRRREIERTRSARLEVRARDRESVRDVASGAVPDAAPGGRRKRPAPRPT
jgi:DNA-binding MarR family transcriptional regulator